MKRVRSDEDCYAAPGSTAGITSSSSFLCASIPLHAPLSPSPSTAVSAAEDPSLQTAGVGFVHREGICVEEPCDAVDEEHLDVAHAIQVVLGSRSVSACPHMILQHQLYRIIADPLEVR